MKKLLLSIFSIIGLNTAINAQCATSSTPTNDCVTFGDQINTFAIGGVAAVGNGGCGASGYNSFAAPVFTLQIGSTTTWSATVGSAPYNEGVGIWIDLNNDGFYANSELVVSPPYVANTFNGTFLMPAGTVGTNLRMRVRCAYNTLITNTQACTNGLSGGGETEDYFVYLTCPASAPTITATASSTVACGGSTVSLTGSGSGSYTWNPGGLTGSVVTVAPSSSTNYTLIASIPGCTLLPNSVTTQSISVSPSPTITVNSGTICSGNSFTIVPSGANTYTFQGGGAVKNPTTSTNYTVVGTNTVGCISNAVTSSITVNSLPTVAVNSGTICSGNSFTIVPSGANSYTIQGGATVVNPLSNATYTVKGTSVLGCASANTATSSVTVNSTPTVSVNSGTICSGNSFTIVPSGASTYTISGGSSVVTPTSNSNYNVTGTSSLGCVSSNTSVSSVTVNALPIITVPSITICIGGMGTLTASGASTYSWNIGANAASITASPTVNTTYTVNGTSSAGCLGSAVTATISVGSAPSIVVNSATVCAGNSATLNASGVTSYTWNTGANSASIVVNPTTNTTYSVSGNLTGCSVSANNTASVLVNVLPNVLASSNASLLCVGQSATLTASGATTYTWNTGAIASTEVISPSVTATYTVNGTDANGCSNMSTITQSVSACTGVQSTGNNSQSLISVYPNPNNGLFSIEISAGSFSYITVVDVLGKVVYRQQLQDGKYTLNLTNLNNGLYVLKAESNGVVKTVRLVKE